MPVAFSDRSLNSADTATPMPGQARAVLRIHDRTRPVDEAITPLDTTGGEVTLRLANATAQIAATTGEGLLRLTLRMIEGRIEGASFGLRIDVARWSTRWYALMPAAAYNGNRYKPTGHWRSEELELRGPDAEIIQQPVVPRLAINGGGALQMQAGDMSMPAIGLYNPDRGEGWLLWTTQRASGTSVDSVIRLEETPGGGSACVEVLAAGVRQVERRKDRLSTDPGATFVAGDVVTLSVRHAAFDAEGPGELARRLMAVRPAMRATRPPSSTPLGAREVLPFSAAWRLQERKFNEQNWVERHGYYSVGMREAPSQDWQTGWVGGCNTTYALLAGGDELTRRRAVRTFDFLLTGRTPSGFLSDRFDEGRWRPSDRVFLRHQADALYFLAKSMRLLSERGERIEAGWLDLIDGVAGAFARMWRQAGQLGQYADPQTGRVLIGGTCAAGLAPAGLLLAADLLDRPEYAEVAVDAANRFAERFTRLGLTNGGPGDIAQAHDSESAFALLASYTHLHESTHDNRWLNAARDAACQAATYVMPYDFDFPADSTFGQLGMRTAGTVFANVQNKHAAPGICSLSGASLLRLATASGERRWLDLLADIASAIPQYMSRVDRPIRDTRPGQRWPVMPEGWINERVNTSDWEVRGEPDEEIGVGEVFGGSTWSETAMLLTHVEVPGVYVDLDRGWCVCADHVRAAVRDRTLRLENPTPFDAQVKVMVARGPQAEHPWDTDSPIDRPRVLVSAHGVSLIDLDDPA